MSRRVEDLDSRVQQGCRDVLRAWADAGLDVILTCTFRSAAEQLALWQMGRDAYGKVIAPAHVVTHAAPGESLHQKGLAIDFLPLVGGKAMWDAGSSLWRECATIALIADPRLSWGGNWSPGKRDLPHLEWKVVADAVGEA